MSQRKEKYARMMEQKIDWLEKNVNSMQAAMEMDRKICADDVYRKEATEAEDRERRRRMHRRLRKIEQDIARQWVAMLIAVVLGVIALGLVFIMAYNMGQAGAERAREAGTTSAAYTQAAAGHVEQRVSMWAGE